MNIHTSTLVAAAAAGAVAATVVVGAVSSHLMSQRPGDQGQPDSISALVSPMTGSSTQPATDSLRKPLDPATPDRIAELEQRINAMAKSLSGLASATQQPPFSDLDQSDEEADADAFDIEQARAQELEAWETRKHDFEQEPVDRDWAFAARDTFLADALSITRENGLDVIDADCRTTRCKVVIEWPSYEDAAAGFNQLLHHEYQINCGKETLLPEPAETNPDAPYQMTMLFDCADARGRG